MSRSALTFALIAALALAAPAAAAAPNYILVSGPGLKRPVMLDDWAENLRLVIATVDAPVAKDTVTRSLSRRPSFDLALFWAWGDRPRPTRPGAASQHGSFYPAHRSQPAVIDLTGDLRLASRRVLRILGRHGVPLRR